MKLSSWKNGSNVGEFITRKLEVVENASNKISIQGKLSNLIHLISFVMDSAL